MSVVEAPTLDTDTIDDIADAFRQVYRTALELAAPRIWAHMQAVVAADSSEQTITDDEWAEIVAAAEDPVGDAVLDGAMAGVITLGALGSATILAARIVEHIGSLIGYSPRLRASIEKWIETTIADEPPGTFDDLIRLLEADSPLSPDKADLVANTETQPAVNAGMHAGLDGAPPAAIRWVSQRDLRVRFAHAVADTDTIPYGSEFSIGGYPARYPGDPQLPFELRVNCRCYLAYVEGSEVRRAVGASKAELRQKANELDIFGRSKMNKGQLQFAVLKALCAQGLAGGPDCPDKFDQMNRTALLTLARGQGIPGRHRMSRQQLLGALRDDLRGTDPGRIASGFASRTEFDRAVKRATVKRRLLPDQEGSGKLPALTARRNARRPLFDEYDDGHGYVVCAHCGLRLHWDPKQGFALLVPEPIVPWSQGGTMDLANLIPSCPSCFRARGGRGLVASAAETTPRDWHGRWTKHGGAGEANYEVHTSPNPNADFFDYIKQEHPELHEDELKKLGHWERVGEFNGHLDDFDQEVMNGYLDYSHRQINSGLRHGDWTPGSTAYDGLSEAEAQHHARRLESLYQHSSDAPPTLYRGQAKGKREPFSYQVGDEYTDKGFGSWSADVATGANFASESHYVQPAGGLAHTSVNDSVFTVLRNDNFHKSIPGTVYEKETIMPAGTTYRVTRVVDFVGSDPVSAEKYGTHRYMEVEVVHRPLDPGYLPDRGLVASAAETTPRDYHGRWTKGAGGAGYEVHEVDDPRDRLLGFWDEQTGISTGVPGEAANLEHMLDWSEGFDQTLSPLERDARIAYVGNAYVGVNRGRRYDDWHDPTGKYSPEELHLISETLEGTFDRGEPFAGPVYRGQKDVIGSGGGTRKVLAMNVGEEFVDNGFGSWTSDPGEAMFFSKSYGQSRPANSVLTRVVGGIPSKTIPGEAMEAEVIAAPGTRYKVTRIVDFVKPGTDQRHRYMEVEAY